MSIGEDQVARLLPPRQGRGLRISILGMLALVAAAAAAMVVYRRVSEKVDERPSLIAKYDQTAPVADGVIGPKEYGPVVFVQWTEGNTLTAFRRELHDPTKSPIPGDLSTAPMVIDPTTSKRPDDLSVEAYAAYTDTSLFLAFRVHDQFVDAQEVDREQPYWNDGVEVYIDGDRVANDFFPGPGPQGTAEGFQLIVDAAGHQYTASRDFKNADWKAAAKRTSDGYVVEIEIPLALIDTMDGPGTAPPGPGSLLHLGMAVNDNDEETRRQASNAYLRTAGQSESPYFGRENAWNFGIKLEKRWLSW
jgi:Carbohydrate family 9 binding domain-like